MSPAGIEPATTP